MLATAVTKAPSSASQLAMADQCVQCRLCLPHCPTYRLDAVETQAPRGRIAYMKALAGGQIEPTPPGDLHLDHWLACRRCESACPAGVQFGRNKGAFVPRSRPADHRVAGYRLLRRGRPAHGRVKFLAEYLA